ncbi:MAG TPA: YebC/PmpR family DNA-binding transcriptional regulator [bacterium]|nr:YebC/PmpR family DNA-binding transcriptional regulator [Patescibacteria group bacterium]HNU76308.1 YebC/PmpR family DNA-binding transcriptional regulator [bacterium]HPD74182.1 YebC/PmpR family DNA-binding transcriptional regulator [bacterium]HRY56698.1 YebC/PmpR family DNA-binding transcriptional regulator [Patescibacteria group bacterium]
MSGHSKWANIKRKKEVTDAKKSKIFSKMSRLISVAAKNGADVDSNPTLRLAVERAKEARMPKENIDRAIDKGSGQGGSVSFFETIYEGFGPNGEAFYIKALTDNINRTVAEVRNIFSKHGGSLGGLGSTAYIFSPDPDNPSYTIEVDSSAAKSLEGILDELDDNDDVQDVFVNFQLPEE